MGMMVLEEGWEDLGARGLEDIGAEGEADGGKEYATAIGVVFWSVSSLVTDQGVWR